MAAIKKGLEEQVTCAICLEQFKDPRVLPCLHTYCKECLEDLVNKTAHGKKVACPGCRAEIQMTVSDVSRLKTNFWINNLLSVLSLKSEETEEVKIVCEMCDSHEKAEGRCVECGEFMCEFCITYHRRQKATKHHDILTLEEIKTAGKVPTKIMYCAKHKGEALKLYCNTCEELVCRDCTIVDHQGHKFLFTGDVIEKEKAQIQAKVQEVTEKATAIEKTRELVQKERRQFEEKVQSAQSAVDQLIDKRIRELQDMRARLKNDIQAINSLKTKQLVAQEEELNLQSASVNSSVEFACRVCAEGSDVDVLSVRNEVMERLSDLAKQPVDTFPCVCGDVKMVVHKKAWSLPYDAVQIKGYDFEVHPQQCTVTMGTAGEPGVVYSTFAGQPYTFTVTVKGKRGENLRRADVECVVENTSLDQGPLSLPVQSIGDVSYQTTFQPQVEGKYSLSVKVSGKNIKGSPFRWIVKPRLSFDQLLNTTFLENEDSISWKMRVTPETQAGVRMDPMRRYQQRHFFGLDQGNNPKKATYGYPKCYWSNGEVSKRVQYNERQINRFPSKIKSFDERDVILIYLRTDQEEAKMILCNETKGQWDVFERFTPPVYLRFRCNPNELYDLDFSQE